MSDQEKNLPKVSIIIPVYNVEPYISACLHSVMDQTYTGELECIIVDDRGTDASMEVAEREVNAYSGKVDFKIVHREQNGGLSAARNTGIRQATGDYLYFLDSDDEITSDCIELLAAKVASLQPDFVIGGYRVTGTNKKYPSLNLPDGTLLQGEDIIKTYSQSKWYMMAWNKLVNRKFLTDNNLYFKEGLLHEDELWSFQLACLAQSMAVVNRETYVYKVRVGSIMNVSQNKRERQTNAYIQVLDGMVSFSLKQNLSDDNFAFVMAWANRTLYYLGILRCPLNEKIAAINHVRCLVNTIPLNIRYKVTMMNLHNSFRFLHYIMPTWTSYIFTLTIAKLR